VLSVAVLSPLAYVLVLQALTLAPVSLVAAARESGIVVGALLGWLVLREPDPGRRLLGTGLVATGIALMAVP
jgi:drug/metabolite transporter (DMT)-like permease